MVPLTNPALYRSPLDFPLAKWGLDGNAHFVRQRHLTKDCLFRLECASGTYALKLFSPFRRAQHIAYEQDVVSACVDKIPVEPYMPGTKNDKLISDSEGKLWAIRVWIQGSPIDNKAIGAIDRAARLLASIHEMPIVATSAPDYPVSLKQELLSACPGSGISASIELLSSLLSKEQFLMLTDMLDGSCEIQGPYCQIHGDYSIDNILCSNGTWFVIDWERTRPGEAFYDLAWAAYRWGRTPWLRSTFIRCYTEQRGLNYKEVLQITSMAIKYRLLRSILHNADHWACDRNDRLAMSQIQRYVAQFQAFDTAKEPWSSDVPSNQ